jgi:hypothetical protein
MTDKRPSDFEPRSNSDLLGELGRATTAYYEATPDRLEAARVEYERALQSFKDGTLSFSSALDAAILDAQLDSE